MREAAQSDHEGLLEAFGRELKNLNFSWVLWRRVFGDGSSEALYDAMKDKCEPALRQIRWQLLRGVTLDLSRLCGDAPRTTVNNVRRTNLTVESVMHSAEFASGQLRSIVSGPAKLASRIVKGDEFIRLRNRVIAHADAAVLTGAEDYPDVGPAHVGKAVDYLVRFHARAEAAHRNGELAADEERIVRSMEEEAEAQARGFAQLFLRESVE